MNLAHSPGQGCDEKRLLQYQEGEVCCVPVLGAIKYFSPPVLNVYRCTEHHAEMQLAASSQAEHLGLTGVPHCLPYNY